jgi:aminopeptidase N
MWLQGFNDGLGPFMGALTAAFYCKVCRPINWPTQSADTSAQTRIAFLLSVLVLGASQTTALEPGVSLELASQRAGQIRDLRYDLSFSIPEALDAPVKGEASISWKTDAPDAPIILDFAPADGRIDRVLLNGKDSRYTHTNEHVVIEPKDLKADRISVTLYFIAGTAPMNRRDDLLYTLFVPARARECFPCFDQPDLKARYTLSLEIPSQWKALANAPLASEEKIPASRTRVRFEQTALLPTYLFAFTVGRYEVVEQTRKGRTIRMFHREPDPERLARNLDRVMELHFDAIEWMEAYTGIPQPFDKFDFALVPGFQYGGMEHAGAILYRDRAILLDATPTSQDELRRASLIAHETAHMWFGNLVTMRWFNDVWLKEVFANFFAAKIVNPAFPDMNHELQFLLRHYPGAYRIDRSEGAHPILQELDNLKDAGSIYGEVIYLKAPIVMRQLEELVGAEAFQISMRDYLKTHQWGNADWDELLKCFTSHTSKDVKSKVDPLVKGAGLARIKADGGFGDPFAYGFKQMSADYGGVILEMESPVQAAAQWMQFRENVLRGWIKPADYLDRLLEHIPAETNAILSAYLLDCLERDAWQLATAQAHAPAEMLWPLISSNRPTSIRKAYFQSWVLLIRSPEMIQHLHDVWLHKISFDLDLSEDDESVMAMELAVRGVDVLDEQLARIESADRKKRFAFILPALASNRVDRAAYFQAMRQVGNRKPESWTLTALHYLHHPIRVEQDPVTTRADLQCALEWLPEIKATGDIFFPKAWLDAAFNGHRSPEAAASIREYLMTHPDLAKDLQLKVLQAADAVFRAESR